MRQTSNPLSAPGDMPEALVDDFAAALDRTTSPQDYALMDGPLRAYAASLCQWAQHISLISARDLPHLATRHLLPAVWAYPVLSILSRRHVVDFGSGAGLPGIPLALALPDTSFYLVESRRRRASFLRHACRVLGLTNVTVVHSRIEDWRPPAPIDLVITRAVSSDPSHLMRALAHLSPRGNLVHYAPRGTPPLLPGTHAGTYLLPEFGATPALRVYLSPLHTSQGAAGHPTPTLLPPAQ